MNNTWRILGGLVQPAPFCLLGIVNLTPDSFSDGQPSFANSAVAKATELLQAGAHILDLGAESTRPKAQALSLIEELQRLMPSLRSIKQHFPQTIISVDTYKAKVAQQVLEENLGQIINDVYVNDPAMPEILASYKPGYILTHSLPCSSNLLVHQLNFFEQKLSELTQAGLPEANILLDPGLGFAKTREQNLEILSQIEALQTLGRPILIGLSRKSMFNQIPLAKDRDPLTQVATSLLASRGIVYHRIHNVQACQEALLLMQAMTFKHQA